MVGWREGGSEEGREEGRQAGRGGSGEEGGGTEGGEGGREGWAGGKRRGDRGGGREGGSEGGGDLKPVADAAGERHSRRCTVTHQRHSGVGQFVCGGEGGGDPVASAIGLRVCRRWSTAMESLVVEVSGRERPAGSCSLSPPDLGR